MENGHANGITSVLHHVPPPKARLFPSYRLGLAVIGFFGFMTVYSLRVNLSVAIVCMVNQTYVEENQRLSTSNTTSILVRRDGEYEWDRDVQGMVLGAFFYGYMCTQILGGWLAEHIGAKRVFAVTAAVAAGVSLATPFASSLGYVGLWLCRFLLGVCQGSAFPAFHAMWSRWAPPMERSTLVGLSYAGAQVGNVLTLPLSGMLCEHGPLGGWPSIFYILGIIALVWIGVWLFFVSDYPASHPRMSAEEKAYIVHALSDQVDEDSSHRAPPTPWLKALSSPAVWAIFVGHFAGDWGAYTMLTCLPSFMSDVLNFDMQTMGFLASIPYIAYFICINLGGFLADMLRSHNILNTLNTRRAAMIVALGTQALFLVLSGYCTCGQEMLAVLFLTIGMGISGFQYAGFIVNYMDIAPAFAGTLLGIGNTLSCAAGVLSPMLMGAMTKSKSVEDWQRFFYLNAGIMIAGTLFFVIFAKGEVQRWALVETKQEMHVIAVHNGEMNGRDTARYDDKEDSNALLT